MAARPPVHGTGRWYPQLEGRPGVDWNLANALRVAFDNIYGLQDEMGISNRRLQTEFGRRTPQTVRDGLQADGGAPLNVNNLLGVLSQPQIGGAPSVDALPGLNDPQSQDGALVAFGGVVFRFDESSSPGVWTPISLFGETNSTPVTVSAGVTTDQNLISILISTGTPNVLNRTMRVFGAGVYTTQAGQTPTVNIKVKLGTLTLLDWTSAASTASATDMPWNFRGDITTAVIGATGTFEVHGTLIINLGTTPGTNSFVHPDTNIATVGPLDLLVDQTLQVTIAFSTQPGGAPFNAATHRQLVVATLT